MPGSVDGPADGQTRLGGVGVDISPPEGEHLAGPGSGGEHQVDDVGRVAGCLGAGPVLGHPGSDSGPDLGEVVEGQRPRFALGALHASGRPNRVHGQRPLPNGHLEHRAHDDLGLALTVHALRAKALKHHVDPAGGQLPQAQPPELRNDELAEHPLVLVDRGALEPALGPQLPQPERRQLGDRHVSDDRSWHNLVRAHGSSDPQDRPSEGESTASRCSATQASRSERR